MGSHGQAIDYGEEGIVPKDRKRGRKGTRMLDVCMNSGRGCSLQTVRYNIFLGPLASCGSLCFSSLNLPEHSHFMDEDTRAQRSPLHRPQPLPSDPAPPPTPPLSRELPGSAPRLEASPAACFHRSGLGSNVISTTMARSKQAPLLAFTTTTQGFVYVFPCLFPWSSSVRTGTFISLLLSDSGIANNAQKMCGMCERMTLFFFFLFFQCLFIF